MQGNLSEIDIRSILQLIELGQRTGELLVEAGLPSQQYSAVRKITSPNPVTSSSRRFWVVFFLNGQIIYANDHTPNLARLTDYLWRYQPEAGLTRWMADAAIEQETSEYDYLWLLLKKHALTPAQSRNIIHSMVHETLFDLFSLDHGSFTFTQDAALSPQLTTLAVTPYLTRAMKQMQQWKQLHPHISAPDQCPAIADASRLQGLLSNRTFNKFSKFVDGKTSIRQIARYINRDIPTVARALYPYIQQGVIHLSPPRSSGLNFGMGGSSSSLGRSPSRQQNRCPTIIYIGNSVSNQELVQTTLSPQGYAVTAIANPLDAFSLIFRLHPDLILCDVALPELDGYELCTMLRQARAFRTIPIIMLSSKDGLMHRLQAKIAGATDYLTKPFGASELLMLVEKYVGSGHPASLQSVTFLADPSVDRLQIDRTDASSISSTPLN